MSHSSNGLSLNTTTRYCLLRMDTHMKHNPTLVYYRHLFMHCKVCIDSNVYDWLADILRMGLHSYIHLVHLHFCHLSQTSQIKWIQQCYVYLASASWWHKAQGLNQYWHSRSSENPKKSLEKKSKHHIVFSEKRLPAVSDLIWLWFLVSLEDSYPKWQNVIHPL